MTATDIFELRKQGLTAKAYESARQLYATDKGPHASSAMFWTAVDMLRQDVACGQTEEARKIFLALQRLLPTMPDKEGWAQGTFVKCEQLLNEACNQEMTREEKPGHIQMGVWGEEVAAAFLRSKGYVILERDWRSGHRDIDIIARNTEYVVFVEVKTRHDRDYGDPLIAVNREKRKNLRKAINHYVKYRHVDMPIRFDIITVVGNLHSPYPEITHLENINIMELYWRR